MADRNHPNTARQVDLADDDPFAELTRIMGFDPRRPARPDGAERHQNPASDQADDDDFNIDLEMEMMGDFAAVDDSAAAGAPAVPAEVPQPDADDADFDFDFAQEFDDALTAAGQEAPQPIAAVDDAGRELDPADDFHDAPAAQEDDAVPGQVAAADDAHLELDLDEAFFADLEDDQGADSEVAESAAVRVDAIDHPPAMAADPAPAVSVDDGQEPDLSSVHDSGDDVELDLSADFDNELAAAVARDTAVESGWTDVQSVDGEAATDPLDAAPEPVAEDDITSLDAAPEPVVQDDMAASFDEALLESDLDGEPEAVDAQAVAAPGAREAMFFRPDDTEPSEEEALRSEDDVLQLSEDDFDLRDDDAVAFAEQEAEAEPAGDDLLEAALPMFPSRPPLLVEETFEAEPDPVEEEPWQATDTSLEDELNALLGNTTASAAAGSVAAESRVEAAPTSAAADEHQAVDHQADQGQAVDPQAEQEPNWDLDEADLLLAGEEEPVEGHHQAEQEPDWDLDEADLLFAGEDEPVEAAPLEAALDENGEDNELDDVPPADLRQGLDDHHHSALESQTAGFDPVDDLDFDHDELDAAIANAMTSGDAQDLPDDHEQAWAQPEAAPAPPPAVPREDPLDVIAALTAKYSAPISAASYGLTKAAPVEDAPDIETVEVQDKAVALADDLDIPELTYEEEPSPVPDYDDIDSEFASLLTTMNGDTASPEAAAADVRTDDPDHDAWRGAAGGYDYAPAAPVQPTHAAYDDDAQGGYGYDETTPYGGQADSDHPQAEAGDYDYDPDSDEAVAAPGMTGEREPPQRRGMLIAAIVGGVAIVGGLGAFALSFGGGLGDDTPVLVRADEGPLKVKPENPGGTTVPNQDNKVYQTVAGTGSTDAPQQEKLVTTAEEPVDMTPPAPEPAPEPEPDVADLASAEPEVADLAPAEPEGDPVVAPKGEDRIEQILQDAEADMDTQVAAIAPRKVRTMVVKPDGTLVPREDPAPTAAVEPEAPATEAPQTEAIEALAEPAPVAPAAVPAAPEVVGATPDFTPPAGEAAGALAPAAPATTPAQPAPTGVQDAQSAFPDTVPIAPTRPSQQPVDVVGEVKPDQVASLNPTASTGAGSWSMQIASQPSEAAAQSSYQDLVRRYGSVLEGREANIVKAEVAGKGTFWRVRVPAQSRNDAITLCESYKAAGGNCFVSR